MSKTKIICTIGPSSSSETVIRKMVLAGMDVARLNFSHGTHKEHAQRLKTIQTINKKYRRHIRTLLDLEGGRIRVRTLAGHKPIILKKRQRIWITNKNVAGTSAVIPIDYSGNLSDIGKGKHIFIDDGNIALEVIKSSQCKLLAEVVVPGELKERKGINIPDAKLNFKGITEKDKSDIKFGIEHGVDYIAQSFVNNAKDMLEVKNIVKPLLPECRLIAKIENMEGIKNLDEILEVSDGVMVARGDMGISLPVYEVPIMQKRIIKECNRKYKFVITATQMLESMVNNKMPTRAEVSDVANAILDGTNYVMLSAETAVGKYPAETVHMMQQIITFTEKS